MTVEIKVPTVGESITEGTIAQWHKKTGDYVRTDEPLFELETEKAATTIPAPASGILTTSATEGQKVAVGSVVGRIDEKATAPAKDQQLDEKATPPAKDRQPAAPRAKQASVGSSERAAPAAPPSNVRQTDPARDVAPAAVSLSPAAAHHAANAGIDVQQVHGTGRGGRIIKEDVLNYIENQQSAKAPPAPTSAPPEEKPAPLPAPTALRRPTGGERESRQRMSSIRQRIAERLVSAQHTAAILTTFNEADLSAILALRTKYKETFQKKYGVGLGFMSFFVKACVEALGAFPAVNARIDGNDIVYHHFYNIGVAVSTERGLMVPVLRDADQMSFAQIEKMIVDIAEKARTGKISVDDLQGGTFTITNGGVFGSLMSTPLLNPPQSAILGMHAIQKRPVVIQDEVVIRPMMYLALSYDHRMIDGREAVSFLIRVKECVENPERLLLEV